MTAVDFACGVLLVMLGVVCVLALAFLTDVVVQLIGFARRWRR